LCDPHVAGWQGPLEEDEPAVGLDPDMDVTVLEVPAREDEAPVDPDADSLGPPRLAAVLAPPFDTEDAAPAPDPPQAAAAAATATAPSAEDPARRLFVRVFSVVPIGSSLHWSALVPGKARDHAGSGRCPRSSGSVGENPLTARPDR
jgi:hypothetical protein